MGTFYFAPPRSVARRFYSRTESIKNECPHYYHPPGLALVLGSLNGLGGGTYSDPNIA